MSMAQFPPVFYNHLTGKGVTAPIFRNKEITGTVPPFIVYQVTQVEWAGTQITNNKNNYPLDKAAFQATVKIYGPIENPNLGDALADQLTPLLHNASNKAVGMVHSEAIALWFNRNTQPDYTETNAVFQIIIDVTCP